jgi:drug/metabolite transporter (DMT)-like permease
MTDNARGILAVLIGSTAFVLNDAVVKLLADEMPSGEMIIVRGVLATLVHIAGVFAFRAARPIAILLQPMMLLRVGAAAAATIMIVLSLRYLPLATVTTVLQVTPLAVTAGAAILYGERVGWQRWLAALTGFAGVLLIVKPGGVYGAAALLVLVTLVFTITRDLTTRGLDKSIPSILVAAASVVAITCGGFLVALFDGPWVVPSQRAWMLMCFSAVCLFVANTFIIIALRTGEIAVVAPFRYAPVPLAILLGWWWWGDIPDVLAFLGIALVLGAGLHTLNRERPGLRAKPAIVPQRSAAK